MKNNFVSKKIQRNSLQTVRDCSWVRDTDGKFGKKNNFIYILGGSVNCRKFLSVVLNVV